jgi:hypothetical protein
LAREPAAGFLAGRFFDEDALPERADAVRPPALALDRAAPGRPAGRRVEVVTVGPGYYRCSAAPVDADGPPMIPGSNGDDDRNDHGALPRALPDQLADGLAGHPAE